MMKHLIGLWIVLAALNGCAWSATRFIEVTVGGSVTLPCVVARDTRSPSAVKLRRTWLRPGQFFFKYTDTDFSVDEGDSSRVSASGDPSTRSVNVTISELRLDDTDRYRCEFVVANLSSEDDLVPGVDDFFLLTSANSPASHDVEWVDVCAGDSAEIPCVSPHGAVEGVTLKRQRGRSGVELLYHSQRHYSGTSESLLPPDRVRLSSVPGPHGLTYNLTLLQMQPEDSGRYSCQFTQQGKADSITQLGRKVVFVSVQGGVCSCSGYTTLLFVVCSAVVILVLLLGLLFVCQVKIRRKQQPHPQPAIYEEMVGVQLPARKLRNLEEVDGCEYRNFSVKSPRLENHYETPSGALRPKE
ncbi:uncharacterized protein LOC128754667 [Synchiropus splendidus]|uniref:uncharacterized protein LOC128754667 n=1 Tax=Synchiropus splendidus TaxID=270530 RepID=UPI00237E7CB0|nr:uncharacterized protein LOC128754667 [Synchiropus splendidus]